MGEREWTQEKTNDLLSQTRQLGRKYRDEAVDLRAQVSAMKVGSFIIVVIHFHQCLWNFLETSNPHSSSSFLLESFCDIILKPFLQHRFCMLLSQFFTKFTISKKTFCLF